MRLLLCLLILPVLGFCQSSTRIVEKKDSLLIYNKHGVLFRGKISGENNSFRIRQQHSIVEGAELDIVTINSQHFSPLILNGIVYANDESIACQSEPRDKGLRVVRSVLGPSHNLNNNAVYDRDGDWLVSLDVFYASVNIIPIKDNRYEINAKGWEIVIRIRPSYYKLHRGLKYFSPDTYSVWRKPVVGWCSWYAYLDSVNEQDIKKVADILSVKMAPYGLNYLQVDDGYQQHPAGTPNSWVVANSKFTSGLQSLARYISQKGLSPGIWTNVAFEDSAFVKKNKSLFVRDRQGDAATGNWINYIMDGSNKEVIQRLITPVYKALSVGGWQYFKLDALRHLKYEGYNGHQEFFRGKKVGPDESLRRIVQGVRKQIGRDKFLLACWGIRPELIGLIDGCRIGNDGFSYAGLAQYNSYNNIIWRNDPDHIVLDNKEAYRSCVATSITGSVFMLTDRAEVYANSPLIDAARRSMPVLFTLPGQVYDVDPSRSDHIDQADAEITGSGPRVFDASSSTITGLFSLEVNTPFENWQVVARLDERDPVIAFKDLGLDHQKQYLVFEFWTKKFIGQYTDYFQPGRIDTNFNCQVFAIKEKTNHPQILATNRHISCGAFDIEDIQWKSNKLSCVCKSVPGEVYTAYIFENANDVFKRTACEDCDVVGSKKQGNVREISIIPTHGNKIHFFVEYE